MNPHMREGQVLRRLLVQLFKNISQIVIIFLNQVWTGLRPAYYFSPRQTRSGHRNNKCVEVLPSILESVWGANQAGRRSQNAKIATGNRAWYKSTEKVCHKNPLPVTGQELVRRWIFFDWVPDNGRVGILLDKAAGLFKSTGETLLHIASARSTRYDYLLDNGANLNAQVASF